MYKPVKTKEYQKDLIPHKHDLVHAIEGFSPRELNNLRYVVEMARNKGLDLEDLAIYLRMSQTGKIDTEVRLDGTTH